jgi:hypothetical protein
VTLRKGRFFRAFWPRLAASRPSPEGQKLDGSLECAPMRRLRHGGKPAAFDRSSGRPPGPSIGHLRLDVKRALPGATMVSLSSADCPDCSDFFDRIDRLHRGFGVG